MSRSPLRNTDVLVAGGGLAGLTTALFLAGQGVECLLIEGARERPKLPRILGIHPRAMELLRSLGLEEEIRELPTTRALARNSGIVAAESLAGLEQGELGEKYVMDVSTPLGLLSPTSWCLCDEGELEELLGVRAQQLGVVLRGSSTLLSFDQADSHGDEVTAVVRDSDGGTERIVKACYLVEAGGTAGVVRDTLSIPFDGEVLGQYVTVRFTADLRAELGDRRFLMCYTVNPALRGALMPLDNASEWLLHVSYDPDREPLASFTEERCEELVRAATGVRDLQPVIAEVSDWTGEARVAGRFRDDRVFLVGDAAHVMPPSGGFDAGTGIIDAHNLAWKISAVLNGWAGSELLESYDEERRPVCAATVEQAVLRAKDRPRFLGTDSGPVSSDLVEDPLVWFNPRYRSSALTPRDEGVFPGDGLWAAENDGRPGSRAPHLRLRHGGSEVSVHDLFGHSMVLLTGPDSEPWKKAARAVAADLGMPFSVYAVGTELTDLDDRWPELYGVTAQGAVLVRPDGVVAWRCADAPIFTTNTLRALTKRILRLDRPAAREER
ncbi:FAD-dependent monooxygenase [Streptomyces sp. NPDC048441]|uniref:FAD-dependent monooxygenase n=1 Tax=Streptomyces sp. NPDC048441 TaxID=3365552 RepID=UPI003715AB5F